MIKEYNVYYRERLNKSGQIFETSVTAENIIEAQKSARADLEKQYVIVDIKRVW